MATVDGAPAYSVVRFCVHEPGWRTYYLPAQKSRALRKLYRIMRRTASACLMELRKYGNGDLRWALCMGNRS